MIRSTCLSWPVSIFMAGDLDHAKSVCQTHCDEVGLCVTVTPTSYIYTDGRESGFIVGLINYPLYPSEPRVIDVKALELAKLLRISLRQKTFSIQTPEETRTYSWRDSLDEWEISPCGA